MRRGGYLIPVSLLLMAVGDPWVPAVISQQSPTGWRAAYTRILFDDVETPAANPSVSQGFRLVGGASVTRDPAQVIGGSASVLLPTNSTLQTDPAVLPLTNGGYYVLEFKYRFVGRASGDKTALVKLIRTDNSDPQFEVWSTALLNNAADQGTFSTGALVPTSGTYAIGVFVYFPGSIVVDDIAVIRVTPEAFTSQPAAWAALASAPFPRLGNYMGGTPDYIASAPEEGVPYTYSVDQIEERLAFSDVVVGTTIVAQTIDTGYARRLRSKNPGIVVLPYRISYEQTVGLPGFPNATIDHEVEFGKLVAGPASGWIARTTKGDVVNAWDFPNSRQMNISAFCPLVNGHTYNTYVIDWINNTVIASGIWDGVFLDNLFAEVNPHIPNSSDFDKLDFDLNRNGVRDETPASVSLVTRAAGNQILQGVRAARGDLALIVGNNGPFPEPAFAPYVNGYLFECVNTEWNVASLPSGFSEAGWRRLLDAYFTMQANTRAPRLNILEGCGAHGGLNPTSNDLREQRFVLGTALLSDGYAEYDLSNGQSAPYWFDEYSVNPQGVAVENRQFKGYLGRPLGSAIELTTTGTIVWSETFESPTLSSAFIRNPQANSFVTTVPAEVLEGSRSLVIHNPDRTAGARAFSTVTVDSAYVPLMGGRTYLLEFDWRVLETFDNAFQGLRVEVPNGGVGSYYSPGLVTADQGRARIPMTLSPGGPYQIVFTGVDAGKVAIDNVRLTEGGVGPWRRDFENGFVLVNPINRRATFTAADLAGSFKRTGIKRIRGTQDPVINSGQTVGDTLTLGAGDAIILLAQYLAVPATLTWSTSGSGSVDASPAGSSCGDSCRSYTSGTRVTLTASASSGSVFAGWSGDTDCLDGVVTVNGGVSCTATFVTTLAGGASAGAVDLNGDGGGDAFSYDPTTGAWSMELGNRSGSFGSKRGTWAAGWTVTAADFNGDRLTDFFVYNPTSGAWAKAINTGTSDFTLSTGQWSGGWTPFIVDFDGNGKSDVFIYSVSSGVWFKCFSIGAGTGEFAYYTGQWDPGWEMQPADWDGDRRTDFFLFRRTDGLWIRATNDGGAGFSYSSETWSPIWRFFVGDYNGDGKSDVFLYAATGLWFLCTNTGTGFSYASESWSPGWGISVGDLDGNGRADVFLYNSTTGAWVEAFSTGLGGFMNVSGTVAAGWQVTLTDLTGDRKADLVLYNPTTGAWAQGLNTGAGAFTFGRGSWSSNLSVVAAATRVP